MYVKEIPHLNPMHKWRDIKFFECNSWPHILPFYTYLDGCKQFIPNFVEIAGSYVKLPNMHL